MQIRKVFEDFADLEQRITEIQLNLRGFKNLEGFRTKLRFLPRFKTRGYDVGRLRLASLLMTDLLSFL